MMAKKIHHKKVFQRDWGVWYGGIYYSNSKGTLYIGHVTRRFLTEEYGPVYTIEINCFKATGAPSTIIEEPPQSLVKDIGDFLKAIT